MNAEFYTQFGNEQIFHFQIIGLHKSTSQVAQHLPSSRRPGAAARPYLRLLYRLYTGCALSTR